MEEKCGKGFSANVQLRALFVMKLFFANTMVAIHRILVPSTYAISNMVILSYIHSDFVHPCSFRVWQIQFKREENFSHEEFEVREVGSAKDSAHKISL